MNSKRYGGFLKAGSAPFFVARNFIVIGLFLCSCGIARGQWDQVIRLTDNNFEHTRAQALIDTMWRLHVIFEKGHQEYSAQPASLFYQCFDNWGNSLRSAQEIMPDSNVVYDHIPGVFLDRLQNIHVVWGRVYAQPRDSVFFYARMNTNGEILTGPIAVCPPNWPRFTAQSDINMIQAPNGLVWIACNTHVMAVSEFGEIVIPLHPIVEPYYEASEAILSCHPDGSVWACIRYYPDTIQTISVIRVDTIMTEPEPVVLPVAPIQIGAEAFHIDNNGIFHFVIGSSSEGLYYLRDARDGSPFDTLSFDPSPYGVGSTYFTLAGRDTLEYYWGQTLPERGFLRVGFALNGNYAFAPTFISQQDFGLATTKHCLWKQSSYWIIGSTSGTNPDVSQLGLIHVAGVNEPPSATYDHPDGLHKWQIIRVWPQPVSDNFSVFLPNSTILLPKISLFNILGQQLFELGASIVSDRIISLQLPRPMPSGTYILTIVTPHERYSISIHHFR